MHTAIIATEALSILYLLILLFSMLRGEEKHRTSIAFSICLCVAVLGVGMDLLSYILEHTSAGNFLLTIVNMLSFFGYDFELVAFAVYVWTIVAEKEKISRSWSRAPLCLNINFNVCKIVLTDIEYYYNYNN